MVKVIGDRIGAFVGTTVGSSNRAKILMIKTSYIGPIKEHQLTVCFPDVTGDRIFRAIRSMKLTPPDLLPIISNPPKTSTYFESNFPSPEHLNQDQAKSFKIITHDQNPLILIKGPPGTGKSSLIKDVVKFYVGEGSKKLLMCSNKPLSEQFS